MTVTQEPARSARIPFFTQAAMFTRTWPSISARLDGVYADGKFSHGTGVRDFEHALAAWTGARYAIGVNSGTDALVLLLRAAGLRHGDEVVVPAYGFVATASAVVLAGGRPRFADIDPAAYALDPHAAEAAITPDTRMVLPAHMFHRLADLAALTAVTERHGLTLVEDSAEAIGMRRAGRHAGLFGAGGVLSFFPSKTLGAIGDAGAVLTDDPRIAERVTALRHHGRPGPTLADFAAINTGSEHWGHNSKMDDIQAAVLHAKLASLDAAIARRRVLADAYTRRLSGLAGVRRLPEPAHGEEPVFYVYLIEVEDRDALARHLAAAGIGTEVYYPRPLPLQPCFADLGHRPGEFPHAEAACRHALALPLHPDLGDDELDRVCEHIAAFYTGGAR
ncbi:DegT/DnrJ/EryC1/StrS family aminotransferase [Actinoplanes rectilineatus]|uniref:DegT/DnrJ/EryC1/StrS family aminotransferase n=1 Tax=Actinoplanes rectilineatus TaxID=113571 RepID=UPI0005F2A228|nr:DegT/DnrJ/EryC1/StrS family aminotransferase [Actinoplanes rectilineatus]